MILSPKGKADVEAFFQVPDVQEVLDEIKNGDDSDTALRHYIDCIQVFTRSIEATRYLISTFTNLVGVDRLFEICGDMPYEEFPEAILIDYPAKKVAIPEGVVNMPFYCFWGNRNVEEVVLPSSLKAITDDCFRDCVNLKKVNTEDTKLTYITYNAFDGCKSLKQITLPETISSIDAWVFNNCTNLTDIYILGQPTVSIDNAFRHVPHVTIHIKPGADVECDSTNVTIVEDL